MKNWKWNIILLNSFIGIMLVINICSWGYGEGMARVYLLLGTFAVLAYLNKE